ncbi:MAG: aminoacyl-tRNA hydrolase [Phycisphaeraceae bacterium]|nr:aminoacyl-tRNA hydrolase [Phycisphaeraceae bacterium]
MAPSMHLIVGLGNPGTQYDKTRHNAGFMAIERFARRHGLLDAGRLKSKFHAAVIEGVICDVKCLLMQPMTFMNRSGQAVREALDFYKLDTSELLIMVDDVALPCGRIRLRAAGSAGGHNGLADVQRAVGSGDYPRLRIGIDATGRVPQVDYVLQRFTPQQLTQLDPALDNACDAIECWLAQGIDKAMSQYNVGTEQG